MGERINRRDFLKGISALSLLPLVGAGGRGFSSDTPVPAQTDEPNILIIVFDALSALNMSLYGYPRETTPNMARFAERATVYHRHYAGSTWTKPGTASLLTATYPLTHHANQVNEHLVGSRIQRNLFGGFAEENYDRVAYTHNNFAELLLQQFSADLDVHPVPDRFSLLKTDTFHKTFPNDPLVSDQTFRRLVFQIQRDKKPSSLFLYWLQEWRADILEQRLIDAYASRFPRGLPQSNRIVFLLEDAIDGIQEMINNASRPFIGYFHLMPPHGGYHTRRDFIDIFKQGEWEPVDKPEHFFSGGHTQDQLNWARRMYDEYLTYADSEFGRLYDSLTQSGRLEDTYVIVTSDHGEMFERGYLGHGGKTLYEPLIRIPLIISRPGQTQRQDVYTPTSCVDVAPTLFQCAGQPIPDWCEGRLLPLLGSESSNDSRSIFTTVVQKMPRNGPLRQGTLAIIRGHHKLIRYVGHPEYDKEHEFYDLAEDPEEMEDLSQTNNSAAAELVEELEDRLKIARQ